MATKKGIKKNTSPKPANRSTPLQGQGVRSRVKKPGTSRTTQEKKDLAKLLFTRNNLSQKEIAERVGVDPKTIGKWVKDELWENLRKSLLVTKEEQLRFFYDQLDSLNKAITLRPEGKRYADSKEANTFVMLTTSIRNMETETGVNEIIDVAKAFLNWLRADDLDQAKAITRLFDSFIKERLKRK